MGHKPSRTRLSVMTEVLGSAVETFYTSLLVLVAIVIGWFAFYVLYRLFKSD